ncbi:MAG: LmeA family phospholipid-binding protein [Armatimonadota bacterium]
MEGQLGSNVLARKWRAGFGLGCLAGSVLMVLILTGLGIAVRRSPEGYPGPVRAFFGARLQTVNSEPGAGLSLEQIQAIRGVRPTIQVTLTEQDINSYLEENPEALGLPKGYAAPRVRFRNGRVHMGVRTKVLLWPVRVTLSMEPRVEGGKLRLSVVKVDAGGVSLPGELRQIAESQVADLLSDRLEKAGLEPESVEVGDGALTVAARLIPIPEDVRGTEQAAPSEPDAR